MTDKKIVYYFDHDLSKKDMGGVGPTYTGKNLLFLLWWTYSYVAEDNLDIDTSLFEVPEFNDFYNNGLELYRIKNELANYNIRFGYEVNPKDSTKMLISILPTDEEDYVKGYRNFIADISNPDTRYAIYHRLIKTMDTMLPIEQINVYKSLAKGNKK